jgi:hypothetical protein
MVPSLEDTTESGSTNLLRTAVKMEESNRVDVRCRCTAESNINGLVRENLQETIDFPIKYGAFL